MTFIIPKIKPLNIIIRPSVKSIALPIDIFPYFETIWFNISVPPVVNPDLKISPKPNPVATAPTTTIKRGSAFSSLIYSGINSVSFTNIGYNRDPTIEVVVFLLPKKE